MKNEYVVLCKKADQILSSATSSTRVAAVEANEYQQFQRIEAVRLVSIDVRRGCATVERWDWYNRVYFEEVIEAYWLCNTIKAKAAAEAEAEAKAWAGCPRNYLSYC